MAQDKNIQHCGLYCHTQHNLYGGHIFLLCWKCSGVRKIRQLWQQKWVVFMKRWL